MKLKFMLSFGLILILTALLVSAAPGDPTKFLNASNNATAWVGGNAGIVNATGNITSNKWVVGLLGLSGNLDWIFLQNVPSYLVNWTSTILGIQTNVSNLISSNASMDTRMDSAEGSIISLDLSNITQTNKIAELLASNQSVWLRLDGISADNITIWGKINGLVNDNSTLQLKVSELIASNTSMDERMDLAELNNISISARLVALEISNISTDERLDMVELNNISISSRLIALELSNITQKGVLDELLNSNSSMDARVDITELNNISISARLIAMEASNISQEATLAALRASNVSMDGRMDDVEASVISLDLSNLTITNALATKVTIGSANLTLVACQNVTGTASNICTLVDTIADKSGTQPWLFNTSTAISLNISRLALEFLNLTDQRYNETTLVGLVNASSKAYTDSMLITTIYNTTNITTVIGTPQGVIANIQTYDGVSYNVSESSSDLDFRVNFTGITNFNQIIVRYKSDSAESHTMDIALWDNASGDWESYRTVGASPNYNIMTMNVYDIADHIVGGIVQIRFYSINVGSSTHKHQFDWVAISDGPATPSSSETDPYAVHKDGTTPLTGNWDAGAFNITASNIFALLNASSVLLPPWLTISDNITLTNRITALEISNTTQKGILDELLASNVSMDLRVDLTELNNVSISSRLIALEASNTSADGRLDLLELNNISISARLVAIEISNTSMNTRMGIVETNNISISTRLGLLESNNISISSRLVALEASNISQEARLISLDLSNVTIKAALDLLRTDNSTQGVQIASLRIDNTTQSAQIADLVGDCPSGEWVENITISGPQCRAPAGAGTVTQIDFTAPGLTGGSVTSTGTVAINETYFDLQWLPIEDQRYNESALVSQLIASNISMDTRMDIVELNNASISSRLGLLETNNISTSARLIALESSNITLTSGIAGLVTSNTSTWIRLGGLTNDNTTIWGRLDGLTADNTSIRAITTALTVSNTSQEAALAARLVDNTTQSAQIADLLGDCASGEYVMNITAAGPQCLAAAGAGTVTSITFTGPQLSGGEITTSGTVDLNVSWLALEFLNLTDQRFNETTLFDELDASNVSMDLRMGAMEASNISQKDDIALLRTDNATQAAEILLRLTGITGTAPIVTDNSMTPVINITVLKDLVTTAPLTGGTDDILTGADGDITLAITMEGDLVTTAPITGGTLDIFPGSGTKTTIALTLLKDLVTTGPWISGGENDVLPGADADLTLVINVSQIESVYQNRSLWTTHDDYPANCAVNTWSIGIGDTLVCIQPNYLNITGTVPYQSSAAGFTNTTTVITSSYNLNMTQKNITTVKCILFENGAKLGQCD